MKIRLKVHERLKEQKMTQRELSKLSGVPPATLSDIVNDKRGSVNKQHLVDIAEVLGIKDIRMLIDFYNPNKEEGDNK